MTAPADLSPSPSSSASSPPSPAAALDAFLAFAPLVAGEDEAAFHALHAAFRESVQPADALEAIWVRDIIHMTWELQRHVRLRAHRLALARWRVVCRVLGEGLSSGSETHKSRMKLAERWKAGDPLAVPHIDELLTRRGYDPACLALEAHSESLADLEALDPMIARLEARRSKLLREIDRRREFAVKLRGALARLIRDTQSDEPGRDPGWRAPAPSPAPSFTPSAGLNPGSAGDVGCGATSAPDSGRAIDREDRLGRRPLPDAEGDCLRRSLAPEPAEDASRLPRADASAGMDLPPGRAAPPRTRSRPLAATESA